MSVVLCLQNLRQGACSRLESCGIDHSHCKSLRAVAMQCCIYAVNVMNRAISSSKQSQNHALNDAQTSLGLLYDRVFVHPETYGTSA